MFKLRPYLRPYLKESTLGPLFKLFEAILELLLPTIVALIINHGVGTGDVSYVLRMGGIMLGMTLLGFGCSLVCQYYAARASQGFGTTLRNRLFSHISSLSFAELEQFGTSSLINRVTNDVNQMQLAVAMLIRLVVRAPFICIGALIMSMALDWRLGLILLAATPVFGIIVYLISVKSAPLYRGYQRRLDVLGRVLGENLSGVRVIRAFSKSREERRRFREASDDIATTAIRVGRISTLLNPLTTFFVNATIIVVLWAGGIFIGDGTLSQGVIIAFINYVTQILLALIVVSNLVVIFTRASSSASRINEVLATVSSVPDTAALQPSVKAGAQAKQAQEEQGANGNASGNRSGSGIPSGSDIHSDTAVSFEHVSFGYNETGELALSDISVSVARGETIGIIGGTGSGKSTFVNLIPRFYDIKRGALKVFGTDVKNYPLAGLRERIAMVPQKASLFSGTIGENIRWGKPDATDEEVRAAARVAQAEEFIDKLPGGYDTMVARGGLNLSGGQKQRLTIARAVVGRPDILILDDSSSALDYATDAALRRELKAYGGGMTVLIVSQRVATIKDADRIIVLDEGRIAGVGSHAELLAGCDVYRQINESQLTEEEAAK